ncbi:MAG: hypothetical protein FWB98_04515 [Defluviitaleaceae bacterium]|nr:hypothetical protein [Defluviitaleaceae bacterium]
MIDFQKELKKYEPVLEVGQEASEEETTDNNSKDMMDLLQYLFAKEKGE